MKGQGFDKGEEIRCPRCKENVLYRYGMTASGKRRYLCLSCNRQFTLESTLRLAQIRPNCPACGNAMHVYKSGGDVVRYRCSRYPGCATYLKLKLEDA